MGGERVTYYIVRRVTKEKKKSKWGIYVNV